MSGTARILRNILAAGILTLGATTALAQVTFNRGYDFQTRKRSIRIRPRRSPRRISCAIFSRRLVIHDKNGQVIRVSRKAGPSRRMAKSTLSTCAAMPNGRTAIRCGRRISNSRSSASWTEDGREIREHPLPHRQCRGLQQGAGQNRCRMGVKAENDRKLVITLERATPYFLELLTHQTGTPVHPPSVEKHGADFVKTGQSRLQRGLHARRERAEFAYPHGEEPHFHDAANVKIDVVNFIPHKDTAAGARRFLAGELHVTTDIPPIRSSSCASGWAIR